MSPNVTNCSFKQNLSSPKAMKVSLLFADVGSGMCSCQNGEKKAKEHVKSKIRDNIVHNTEMADICTKKTNKQTKYYFRKYAQ